MSEGSFAQNHLEKYGWEKGKGLGRTETGITDAIKPKLKFDTAGIGHDAGEQFSFHWWDHVFNKAAKNIHVENSEEGVKVKQKGAKANLISNKRTTHENKTKPLLYGSFVKCGTLNPDGAISQDKESSSSSSSDESDDDDKPPDTYEGNDEMLFKACGGRTAHKGARHGLHLSGKLQRIEEQENLHINMMKMRKGTKGALAKDEMERGDNSQNIEKRKRNKHKKRTKERNEIEESLDTVESPRVMDRVDVKEQVQDGEDNVDGGKQSKKKKKKKSKHKKETRISENGEDVRIDGTDEVGLNKDMSLPEVELKEDDDGIGTTKSGKKKSKKGKKTKQRTNFEMNEKAPGIIEGDEMQDESPFPAGATRKKKSKKEKRKIEIEGEAVTSVELEDEDQNSVREGQRDSKRKRTKDKTETDECIDNDKGTEVESDEELRPKKKKKERRKDEKRHMKEEHENNFTSPSSSQGGNVRQDDTISKSGSKKKKKRKSDIYH